MKKTEAIEKAGDLQALADIFGITKSAICQWSDDIPEPREYELRVKKPEWFAIPGQSAEVDHTRRSTDRPEASK